jgi:hypothetical protein
MSADSMQHASGCGPITWRNSLVQIAVEGKHASRVRGNDTAEMPRFSWNFAKLNEVWWMNVSFCQGSNKKCQ